MAVIVKDMELRKKYDETQWIAEALIDVSISTGISLWSGLDPLHVPDTA